MAHPVVSSFLHGRPSCGLIRNQPLSVGLDCFVLIAAGTSRVRLLGGFGNLRLVRQLDAQVPTTTDDATEIQRCYGIGCNARVTKPNKHQHFANAIRRLGLFFSGIPVRQTA